MRARRLLPAEAARRGKWLVLAPHPDDETLGAGGLVAALSAVKGDVSVAFLTDGARSHVGAPGWSEGRIARMRAQEGRAALRQLGARRAPLLLNWSDACPFQPGGRDFEQTVRRLTAHCRHLRISNIVASWAGDPHCDHQAAAQVAKALGRRLHIVPRFYSVWGWTVPDLEEKLADMRATAIPVGRWRARQRRALAQHRSQLGGRIWRAQERFVLPRPMRRLVGATHILLLEDRDAA